MSEFIMPFDLETWFVQVFAGDIIFFVIIAGLVILSLGAYFRMKMMVVGAALLLFLTLFKGLVGNMLFVLGFVICAFIIGWSFTKLFR